MCSGCIRDVYGMKVLKETEAVRPKFLPCKSQISPIFCRGNGKTIGGWREKSVIVAYARMLRNNNYREVVQAFKTQTKWHKGLPKWRKIQFGTSVE